MARGSLNRQSMEDGGEVYKGPLASRALRAVGARAMTMDKTIIVDEDFDPGEPDDQALYAHERLHQMESGGDDGSTDLSDSEEVAAQAVERMVLHRAQAGEDFGGIMRDVSVYRAGRSSSVASGGGGGGMDGAAAGYQALLRSGKSHDQVVQLLARRIMKALFEGAYMEQLRGPTKSF
ncbi:MAG: DUF4157 domain-containing protein [Deltaproteobacteria bacterium]|nr:DUF4157 domain-containing protein [Deltaproteobacteria bacterium]